MSLKHLTVGSELPPKEEGKLRLYSMQYCPYAHRARLVLDVKGVPYDTVNVNLINKPEWLFTIHPEGKVPALDIGSKIIVESLDICDYLNETYPDPPLYSLDDAAKTSEKELIKKIGDLVSVFTNIVLEKEKKTPEEWLKELQPHLERFETELDKRSTTYFGGENPNMVDYMLWPWGERAGVIPLILGAKLPVDDNDYKRLRAWRKAMRARPEIASIYNSPQKFQQVVYFKTKGLTPDYDNLK